MAHYPNQNASIWKKTRQTACITVQYKFAIMKDFKVSVDVGNM